MKFINVLFALIIAVGLFLPFNYPVHATTVNLAVTAEGDVSGGMYTAGAGDWHNMQDGSNASYHTIGYSAPNCAKNWNFANTAIPAGSVINSLTISAYATQYVASSFYFTYNGSTIGTYEMASGVWHLHTQTFVVDLSGNPWTTANIDAGRFGYWASYSAYSGTNMSEIWLTVDYTAPVAPTVTTQAVSAITPTTATGNGNVTSDGGSVITERGTVIAATANPTTADHKDTAAGTTGAFTTSITALTKGTLYHVRAYAINAVDTSYGADVQFTTINDPTISTLAASLVSSTTARINSNVTFDGSVVTGEHCTVTFVYVEDGAGAPYANYAAVLAEGGSSQTAVAGTWITGQNPYLDISALTVSGNYSFAVKIINSTATTAYGSVLTFTTESGVYTPTNFTAIPTATSVSLAWAKGVGAQYTLVKYSDSTYPLVVGDGIAAYLDTGNSKTLTGLTPGTTYYFSAWGKTAAVYSASSITTIATTLAYDTAVSTGTIEAPPSNSWWNQTPSASKVGSIPVVSALVSQNATVYAIPEASLWYLLWTLFSVGMGIIIYNKSGMNLVAGLASQALLFALGAVLGLVMLWIMVIFMIIGVGFTLWGNRH
jgi:hypothetical protein